LKVNKKYQKHIFYKIKLDRLFYLILSLKVNKKYQKHIFYKIKLDELFYFDEI